MKRRLIKVIKGEKGQALPIVLVLLALGGLIIAPSLSYASTSLNAGQVVEKNVRGVLAADAGIEDALWKLKKGQPISELYQLPEPVNQMAVTVEEPVNMGTYTLYTGDLIVVGEPPQEHYDWLAVDGEMVWDELEEAYQYTITVTWQSEPGTPSIKLEEVGVRLPVGYEYKPDSAANPSFPDNLSTEEPVDTLDGAGAHMLGWAFPSPSPDVSQGEPIATQTFYVTDITGEGEREGDYTWVVAQPPSIGIVGEVIGTLYRITATATRPEDFDPTATVVADAIVHEVEIRVIRWQINPQ